MNDLNHLMKQYVDGRRYFKDVCSLHSLKLFWQRRLKTKNILGNNQFCSRLLA